MKQIAAYRCGRCRRVMEHRTTTLERPDGTDKVVDQVLVTGKGLARLAKLLGGAA